jgi:hypothetical protein
MGGELKVNIVATIQAKNPGPVKQRAYQKKATVWKLS